MQPRRREATKTARRSHLIDQLRHDLRYAFRTLIGNPAFTVVAVITIAVGIGANTAIFSIVYAVLLRPLPFPHPDALVLVAQTDRRTGQSSGDAAPANFLDWRVRNRSFAGLSAYRNAGYELSSGDHPERIAGAIVSSTFFDVLAVKPAIGRGFRPADEGPGAARVAIIDAALWKQRFGGRPEILGEVMRLNGEPHTIIGIMPPGIDFPDESQIWTPPHWRVPDDPLALGDDPSAQRSHEYLFVLGRLQPGVSPIQAQRDMDTVAAGLERDYPNDNRNVGIRLTSLHADLVGDVRPTLIVLFAAVGVLLLIATANVSGLLIARATGRHQEIAVRVALGATRRRILAQLLTESVLLATVAAACGVVLAMWMMPPLVSLAPHGLGLGNEIHLDLQVLLFALAVSVLAGIAFGLAPARQLVHASVHEDLKQTARGGIRAGQRRLRAALVASEIALAVVLLVAAGLTIKSFIRLQRVPTGFDADRVLTLSVALPQGRYPGPPQRRTFWEHAIDGLRTVPGIETVGATSRLPLSGGNSTRGFSVDGRTLTPPAASDYRAVSPDYFRALGILLYRGRAFRDDDDENRPLVAIVSQSLARRYWPALDPIGRRLSIDGEHQLSVVGVVGDVHHASLDAAPQPTLYVPYRQDPWPTMTLVLRTPVVPATLAPSVHAAIWQIDKDQPVGAVRTMADQVSLSVAQRRFSVTLLTAFGSIAVALAAIGLYGVLAFTVAQRRREIGVRMALGARPADVVLDVMRHGLRLAALGVGVGLALASATTRLINALLFATSPTDVATFFAVSALLVLVTAAATLIPALRASRVDPIVALREE